MAWGNPENATFSRTWIQAGEPELWGAAVRRSRWAVLWICTLKRAYEHFQLPIVFHLTIPLNSTTNTTTHNLAFDKWGLNGSSAPQLTCAACCRTCAVPYELRCLPRRDRAAAALRSPAAYRALSAASGAALLNGQHRLNQFSGFHSGLTSSPGFHSGITNSPGHRSGVTNSKSIRPDFTPVNATFSSSILPDFTPDSPTSDFALILD
ncbi:hypothetical protein DdX_00335 [Ditylenchus destructor]|uniref:Uncharacterized protein n=1 Tax=Ditylenchus destructor TaxID=166010 RepID=A0AAD4NGB5_9BILA|nr:hypothetical protein DdX_00335 [Ditylenchus destructor]